MMNNAYNLYDTHNASRVLWSDTLLNTVENEDVFSPSSSLQSTMKPCFSLAHTSLLTSIESLPAFLAPIEIRSLVDEMETDNDPFTYYANEDVEQVVALFTHCLV